MWRRLFEELDHATVSPYMRAKYVKFDQGGHTKWHYHTREQLLLVNKGSGFIEIKGSPVQKQDEGDSVIIPNGVWHRHGSKGEEFIHLAVTTGKTIWDEDDSCE